MGAVRMKGGATLDAFKDRLRAAPTSIAHAVASKAAPELTRQAQGSFDTGRTVYGDARPAGVNGDALSLVRTGATRGLVRFVNVGTQVRCVLGTSYARFLIGKYAILPAGARAALPAAWSRSLARLSDAALTEAVTS